jgi:lysine-specific permease
LNMNSATNQSTSKTQTTQGQGELKRGLKSRHLTTCKLQVQLSLSLKNKP